MSPYIFPGLPARPPKPQRILEMVAEFYGFEAMDLLKQCRRHEYVTARQIAWYLHRMITGATLPELGKMYGRDHTTVLHGLRSFKKKLESRPDLKTDITTLHVRIKGV